MRKRTPILWLRLIAVAALWTHVAASAYRDDHRIGIILAACVLIHLTVCALDTAALTS